MLARLACLWLALVLLPAAAQIPFPRPAASPAQAAGEAAARDPLDRSTPRRTVSAFIRAAHRDNMATAVQYLQGSARQPARAERQARDLIALMDRHFHQPLSTISDAPEGSVDDGLPLDRERIGPLRIAGEDHFLELVRVDDPSVGKIWVFSSATLAQVSDLREEESPDWVETLLPRPMFTEAALGFSWADLVVWAASLALPLLVLPWLLAGLQLLARRLMPTATRSGALDAWYEATRWPAILAITLGVHGLALNWFGPTLSFRIAYSRLLVLLLVAVVGWGMYRVLSFAFRRAGARARALGRGGTQSLLILGERMANMLLLLLVFLAILAIAGFDIKAVLAGLGIVGVALALGAQRTIENILGGMMLLGDEALGVGDLCRINNRLGTVEDITLRSVRFRTLDHTLLLIPAGVLAQAEIENFATRGKFLLHQRLRLAYGASVEQLRRILEEGGAWILENGDLEQPGARLRLVEFSSYGIELEVYAYVLTTEMPKFLATREEFLLRLAAIVEAAGARFADALPVALPAATPAPTV